ncbi:MAG: hypothetical protein JO103_13885 [Candidatus Eremiobacteraeota bacterium]|nr:hypothetical protein [Candidatus Eremiobacteraeota bacterium]MBV9407528.1 hypothetical protein [Candidatus Eremiobacteraeota bacterium]
MPPVRRPGLSVLLVAGALVLLVSILIGQKLGDRVLLQTEQRVPIAASGITPVPEANPTDQAELKNWKRLQVVAVATDPAFPDPRVTPPPTPAPRAAPPTPKRTPTPPPQTPSGIYTSPPLPIPLVSHDPNEVETEAPSPTAEPSP